VAKEVNGGDNSSNLENMNPNKKAIHIHGGMEHKLVGYAKYYSYESIKFIGNSEFIKETNHNRKYFSRYW
jgi:hypothetical protein